jgi:hypothetical protein
MEEVEGLARPFGPAATRATSVPFTAVPSGPERTATDTATTAMTCAVGHPTS